MNVNPGELSKRIEILEQVATRDEDGYESYTRKTVRTCWAKITRTSGTELAKADADFSQVKVRFLIYCPAVPLSRKMLVRYGGQDYEITYLNDYGDDHVYLEIWCTALSLEG